MTIFPCRYYDYIRIVIYDLQTAYSCTAVQHADVQISQGCRRYVDLTRGLRAQ